MKNVNKFLLIFAIAALAGNMAKAQIPSSILGEYIGELHVDCAMFGLDETFSDITMEVKQSSPNYSIKVEAMELPGGINLPAYELEDVIITQSGNKYILSKTGTLDVTIDEIVTPLGTFTNVPVKISLDSGSIENNNLILDIKAVATVTIIFVPVSVTINVGFDGMLNIPDCDPVTNAKAQIENCEKATVTWNAVNGAIGYAISRDGVDPVIVTASPYTEDFEFEHGKSYTWKIKTICELNEATAVSTSATADCESEVCNPVIGEAAVIDDCKTATITWNAVAGAIGYEVNDEFVEGTEYTEEREFEHGVEYSWEIVTVCESGKSEPVEVKATGDCDEQSINEFANSVSIYPNPTDGKLTIGWGEACLAHTNIEILDMMGKCVATAAVETHGRASLQHPMSTSTLDLSHLPTGVYFIRIQTENGTIMRKVVKK